MLCVAAWNEELPSAASRGSSKPSGTSAWKPHFAHADDRQGRRGRVSPPSANRNDLSPTLPNQSAKMYLSLPLLRREYRDPWDYPTVKKTLKDSHETLYNLGSRSVVRRRSRRRSDLRYLPERRRPPARSQLPVSVSCVFACRPRQGEHLCSAIRCTGKVAIDCL